LVERQEVISEKVGILSSDLSFIKGRCEMHTTSKVFKKSKKTKVGDAN
jgi:hypothetical protein